MTHYDHDALIAAGAAALPALLRLFWVLAAGAVTVTVLPVPRVPQAFKDAVRLSAARGKLWDSKPAALGPLRDWAVPQRWFLHFYLVGIAATAATLGAFGSALGHAAAHDSSSSGSSGGARMIDAEAALSLLGLALFLVHVTRRAAETALLMRYPPDAAMHGIAYAFGLSYYAVAPLSLVPERWFAAALPAALGLGGGGSGSGGGGAPCAVSTIASGAAAAAAAVRSGGPVIVALAVVVSLVVLGCYCCGDVAFKVCCCFGISITHHHAPFSNQKGRRRVPRRQRAAAGVARGAGGAGGRRRQSWRRQSRQRQGGVPDPARPAVCARVVPALPGRDHNLRGPRRGHRRPPQRAADARLGGALVVCLLLYVSVFMMLCAGID